MTFYKHGVCGISGFYKGWGGIATLDECKKQCLKEEKCQFFSFMKGSTCSRYSGAKCEITLNQNTRRYITFQKVKKSTKGKSKFLTYMQWDLFTVGMLYSGHLYTVNNLEEYIIH